MKPLIRKLWYTLTEAANYLTRNTEGDSEVTVSDVLQLAVNEQIALSIKVTGVSDYSVPFGHLIPLGVLSDGERMDALNREVEISGLTSPTIINSEKFHVAYQGNVMLDVGLWDLEFQSAKRILNKLWGDSKTSIDSDIDRLNPWTFKSLYYGPYDDKIVIFDIDLNVIISVPPERIPEGTYLVVKQSELSRLLSEDTSTAATGQADDDRKEYPSQLEALTLAWRKNWKNADPADRSTCPKKESVKDWLMGQGFSAKNADAGATIIKPQWATDKGW
ncbi:hypothetical protein [Marinobacter gelidimuriae]|uniref:hypothetical protein n=1 Tax=Marinobacter gelidimuriae TaxID=2739064 RepID=UPI00036759A4|nr:hypothetical protein [Marinobacter gelidimuriae]